MIELRKAGMTYGTRPVLRDISKTFAPGEMVSVVGPNGAGKSTLLAVLMGLRPGHDGDVLIDNRRVEDWPRPEFARLVSFVPQSVSVEFPFTAEEIVTMGRTPYGRGMFESAEDRAAVATAMEKTDTTAFAKRDFRSLSGGERQRVILATALAQTPKVLLFDEPTTFLDLKHQLAIFQLLRAAAQDGVLVIAVTHDLNLAATCSDRVIVLRDGIAVADGPPVESLSPERLREVFEVNSQIVYLSDGSSRIVYGV